MTDAMSLLDTAHFLNLPTQDVVRMAEAGKLPGGKRAGRWEFNRRALLDHVESTLGSLPVDRLAALESGLTGQRPEPPPALVLEPLLLPTGIDLALPARTRASVLSELVKLAEKTELVWDAPALLEAVRRREDLCPTAMENGIAIPHPRRTPENAVGDSLIVFGRTTSPVPFGAIDRTATDLFFLVACTDELTHLKVIARLCRVLRNPDTVDALREAEDAHAVRSLIAEAEMADLKKA